MKLLIIPADKRQKYMTEILEENGFECTFFEPNLLSGNTQRNFDAVIFALPSVKFSRVNCEYDVQLESVLPLVKKGGWVFSAMADEGFLSEVKREELKNLDYYCREELIILNAALTAQGVLEMVLINSNVLLSELKILVTGYGKTGEAIADVLQKNRARVTVAARKIKDRARVKAKDMTAISFDEISENAENFNFVINTVPERVIGHSLIKKFDSDCIFLEVASKPYGIDISSCEKQGKKVIIAASLPGKYVARSAGVFIAQTVINLVKEESVNE